MPPPSLGLFSVPPVVTVFTLSDAWNGIGFLFLALQVLPCEPGCRCVDLFPPGWNGGFHLWRYSGMLLGRLRRPEVSPRCKRLGSGLPGLLGSCFWSFLPLSGSGCGCLRCPSCSFHPAPAWFPRRLRLRGCWRWIWLRKLSGRSPLGVLSARFPARHLLP